MKTQPCPKCSKQILQSDWKEHMKICLMDKKSWLDQKQDTEYRQTLPSLASGDEIAKNLKRFASQRPDLYQDQDPLAQTSNDAKVKPVVIWDGQSNQLTRTHANVAMMQAQQKQNQLEADKLKR